jgi:hypothetical protein
MLREGVFLYETFVVVFSGSKVRWWWTAVACYGVSCVNMVISFQFTLDPSCYCRSFCRHPVGRLRNTELLLAIDITWYSLVIHWAALGSRVRQHPCLHPSNVHCLDNAASSECSPFQQRRSQQLRSTHQSI